MNELLNEKTCFKLARANELSLLVDAEIYYAAFVEAARKAQHSILLSGWQFDTETGLLRADPPNGQDDFAPRFLPFLNELCESNSALQVHILAWDYSAVYALERQWFQSLQAKIRGHDRVHLAYWKHPNPGGSHHHKYALIDDWVAFAGGLDICDSRWDQRSHPATSPFRIDTSGNEYKPFHDIQLAMTGPVVSDLRGIFGQFWEPASDVPLLPVSPSARQAPSLFELAPSGLRIRSNEVALSRTVYEDERTITSEIEALLTAAIASAESHIYIENQYFTSRAILSAFRDRLQDAQRSRLDVIVVMPDGADTPKEDFVLGDRQRTIRYAMMKLADEHQHRIRFVISSDRSDPGHPISTFIHAKVMIVDDRFLTVGSANLTNRSMRIDTELNISVEGHGELNNDIRDIRASLLAEHAGIEDSTAFSNPSKMVEAVDHFSQDSRSKLQSLDVEKPDDDDPLLIAIFDPSGALSSDVLEDALQEEIGWNDGRLKRLIRTAGQRLGVVDTN